MTALTDQLRIAFQEGKKQGRQGEQLKIANDALYPSYGQEWRNEIDVGPEDPKPGEPVFGVEDDGQMFFDFVRQLQINPKLANLLLPGETPAGGKGGLGSMSKDALERWIKENGITGPGADKIRKKHKGLQGGTDLFPLADASSLTDHLDSAGRNQRTGSFKGTPLENDPKKLIETLLIGAEKFKA